MHSVTTLLDEIRDLIIFPNFSFRSNTLIIDLKRIKYFFKFSFISLKIYSLKIYSFFCKFGKKDAEFEKYWFFILRTIKMY